MLAQVGRDLEPWKEAGITLEMVEKAYCTENLSESMRIQVRGQPVQHCRSVGSRESGAAFAVYLCIQQSWLMLTHVISDADHSWVHLPGGADRVLPITSTWTSGAAHGPAERI